MKAADLIRVGDMKDATIRREAFAAIARFSAAMDAVSRELADDSLYSHAALVEAARAAVIYLSDDLREPIDRALGVVDLRDELIEALGSPKRGHSIDDDEPFLRVAAIAIVSGLVGLPKRRDWPTCEHEGCNEADRNVTWTLRPHERPGSRVVPEGPYCWTHYQEMLKLRREEDAFVARAARMSTDATANTATDDEAPL